MKNKGNTIIRFEPPEAIIRKIHRLKLLIPVIIVSANFSAYAQEPQLSQFYASPVFSNPAFAGSERKMRIVSSVHNKFTALKTSYKTAVLSFDGFNQRVGAGLGLIAAYDLAGDGFLQTINIGGVYSHYINVSENWAINLAVQGSIVQRSYDAGKLRFGDQLNDISGYTGLPSQDLKNLNFEQKTFSNFSSGILLFNGNFFGGFAIHNMFEPNQSFVDQSGKQPHALLPRRYTVHGGFNIGLSRSRSENKLYVSPNIIFIQQQNFYQMNLGIYLKKHIFTVGAFVRQTTQNSNAFILIAGFKLPGLSMGYSYDLNSTKTRTNLGGSHEISLAFHIGLKSTRPTHGDKFIKSPAF